MEVEGDDQVCEVKDGGVSYLKSELDVEEEGCPRECPSRGLNSGGVPIKGATPNPTSSASFPESVSAG